MGRAWKTPTMITMSRPPPSDDDGGSDQASRDVSLTDSHRDPTPHAADRPILSTEGAMHLRRSWQRAAVLVPLEIQYQEHELSRRSIAALLSHRRKRCDRMVWPEFRASVLDELEDNHRQAAGILLNKVEACIQKRLAVRECRLIRRTGSWQDPGKNAVQAVFARLLTGQLLAGEAVGRDYIQPLVDSFQYQLRYSGYWATLAMHLEVLDDPQKEQFWAWYRAFPRPG